MCVCLYVCVYMDVRFSACHVFAQYLCLYVCACERPYVRIFGRAEVCTYGRMHARMYVYLHICVRVRISACAIVWMYAGV